MNTALASEVSELKQAQLEDMVLTCKDVAVLVQDLPAEFVAELPTRLVAKVKRVCELAFAIMDGPEGCKFETQMLSDLIMECSIAVPSSTVVEALKDDLGKRLERHAGEQKMGKVAASWLEIVSKLGQAECEPLLEPFVRILRDCEGMRLPGDVAALLKGIWRRRWLTCRPHWWPSCVFPWSCCCL